MADLNQDNHQAPQKFNLKPNQDMDFAQKLGQIRGVSGQKGLNCNSNGDNSPGGDITMSR